MCPDWVVVGMDFFENVSCLFDKFKISNEQFSLKKLILHI